MSTLMSRCLVVLLCAICAPAAASTSPDATLETLSSQAQRIVLGKVVGVHPVTARTDTGDAMQVAEIALLIAAKGKAERSIHVVFAPMQSDEADLALGREYVLFLSRSNRLQKATIGGLDVDVYEVFTPHRGVLLVSGGQVFSGPLSGEPDMQDVCALLRRISKVPCH